MILNIMIFNNYGKPRAVKFYKQTQIELQQQILKETFDLVTKRSDHVCNFLEGGKLLGGPDTRVIYRHYATLYFVFSVDSSESELGILDLIQVFVETLDRYFENVCELDLIFNVEKVYAILDEIVIGGMVVETSISEITSALDGMARFERSEQDNISHMFSNQKSMTRTSRPR
eukprot:CFRG1918T1